jgi:hypothetical protein
VAAIDDASDQTGEAVDFDDPNQWLAVPPEGSDAAYRDMTSFIATVTDRRLADQLERAVQGRGAFCRFRDTLSGADDEFTRWHRFAADRQRGRARVWLADCGYQPRPGPARRDPA